MSLGSTPNTLQSTFPAPLQETESGGVGAYWALTKPRVTFMVVLTAVAGYAMAVFGSPDWGLMLHLALGTFFIAGGTAGLNQALEAQADGRMQRTSGRPLPAGQLEPSAALAFTTVLVLLGAFYLALWVSPTSALLGVLTSSLYLFLYTPLKVRTVWCTAIGAVPGALPPLMGWAAARSPLEPGGLALFALLFLWQFPHFYAIAWMYRDDYRRGGFRMLPLIDWDGRRTARHILVHTLLLIAGSLLPFAVGMTGWIYLAGALLLSWIPLKAALRVRRQRTPQAAAKVLRASVLYLPLMLILLIADKL
ncbi:MAG TPA: heme o synthase [Acidobacteriota bacterium]|nr:heme o synthase [Acidobacteriota bacterium]